ncbi:acyl-CoA thioesterase II [Bradyrhizobium sp. B117]|uniref:acyl-CoA thioesterase n=1 Tax=Bradyrhizobium sp. B117 TaxID=3140246 RepID=UPI003182F1B0
MSKRPIDLLTILDLERIQTDLFLGKSSNASSQQVFGGQIIGQSMVAASRSVKGQVAHSLHGYFVRAGDPRVPILYKVGSLRDSQSYSIRSVTAIQHGNMIFSIMISFHAHEQSVFDHQDYMPALPPPERHTHQGLSKRSTLPAMMERSRAYCESDCPLELRPVEIDRNVGENINDARTHIWIKSAAKLPDDPALHKCALAYASDWALLDTVMARYGRSLWDRRMMSASLDHAMWFHRPFRADDWLLYVQESPSAQGGRGFARGLIFDLGGALVASVAQEGVVRKRR